ncbi:hypothetical protein ACROYT_G026986 [Oculina patagonica]
MDGDPHVLEQSLSARERALQGKIVRLEKKLEGYQSQIDIIDNQREQLEERAINMESTLAKTKKELLEAKKEVMEKEIAEKDLAEKLKSMTQQAEEYKILFIAERNKNKHSIEALETILSTAKAEMATRKEFDGFLNEMLSAVKEGFYAQLKVVFDKLTGAENKLHRSSHEINQSKSLSKPQAKLNHPNSQTGETTEKKLSREVLKNNYGCPTVTGHPTLCPIPDQSKPKFTLGKSDAGPVNSVPFTLGKSDEGTVNSSTFAAAPDAWTCEVCYVENNVGNSKCIVCSSIKSAAGSVEPLSKTAEVKPITTTASVVETEPAEDQQGAGCTLYKEFLSTFVAAPDAWTCEVCYVENNAGNSKCIVCSSIKSAAGSVEPLSKTAEVKPITTTASVVETEPAEDQQGAGCTLYKEFLSTFVAAPDAWTCEVCYVENNAGNSKCIACSSIKSAVGSVEQLSKTAEVKPITTTASVVETEPAEDQQGAGCTLYKEFLSTFVAAPDAWTCEVCYVENNAGNSKCIACSSIKSAVGSVEQLSKTAEVKPITTTASVVETEPAEDQQGAGCTLYKEFLSTFVAAPDAWTCEVCYVENNAGNSKCIVCSSIKSAAGSVEPLSKTAEVKPITTTASVVETEPAEDQQGAGCTLYKEFLSTFVAAPDAWTCEVCYVENNAGNSKCIVCSSIKSAAGSVEPLSKTAEVKPITTTASVVETEPAEDQQGAGCTLYKEFLSTFVAAPDAWTCEVCYVENNAGNSKCIACSSIKSAVGSVEQLSKTAEVKPITTTASVVETEPAEDQQGAGCTLYKEFLSTFVAAPDAWTCEVCYVENNAGNSKCIVCSSIKSAAGSVEPLSKTAEVKPITTTASVVETEPAEDQQGAGCTLYKEFLSTFVAAPDAWTCEVCYVENNAGNSKCIACSSIKSAVGSVEQLSKTAEVTDDQRKTAKCLELPNNLFGYEHLSPETCSSQSETVASKQDQPTRSDDPEEISTLSKSNFLFGSGAGSPLFAARNADDDHVTTEGNHDHDGPHFEPIIPLPDKIDVKTGEEDEEVMFSHRAKLYRFVSEDKQWKERGVGDIKLLRNRQSGKMRVLMRRDQVLKICANHQITTDMKLQPNAGSEKSWVWSTLADFSEQECNAEQLAVRFKSEDIAKQFKETFEECQEMLKTPSSCQEMLKNQTPLNAIQEDKRQEEVKEDFLTKFKAAEGSWECDICMVRNDSDKVECVACGTLKPGEEEDEDEEDDDDDDEEEEEEEEDKGEEDDHDGPHFEPIIPLPDKIDVKTGEEDEEVMFSHRAKLYRFVPEFSSYRTKLYRFVSGDKQWKERGVGDIKLLRNRQSGKMRVLMRRDQVLKICANHQITTDMKLQPNAGSEKSWVWSTLADFSEQECNAEVLAVRFKSEDIAKLFKETKTKGRKKSKKIFSLSLKLLKDLGSATSVW